MHDSDTAPRRGWMLRSRRARVGPGVIWLVLAALGTLVVWALPDIALIVLLAILVAIMLRGAADWLSAHTHMPPRLALTLVTLAIVVAGGFLAFWLGPHLVGQVENLASQVAKAADQLRVSLARTAWGKPLTQGLSGAAGPTRELMGSAETAVVLTARTLADLVVLAITALYFAAAPGPYLRGMVALVPIEHRARASAVLRLLGDTLRRWILGQLVDMVTVGVLSVIGLLLAGVPEAYALALLAGVLTFVPYFGAIIAAIPALVVAASVSWTTALWTLGVYLVCHAVEGYVVAPLVQRRLFHLPPAVSILSMTVMGALFGPLGVVVGVPVAAIVLVLVRELYLAEVLGDPSIAPPR